MGWLLGGGGGGGGVHSNSGHIVFILSVCWELFSAFYLPYRLIALAKFYGIIQLGLDFRGCGCEKSRLQQTLATLALLACLCLPLHFRFEIFGQRARSG